VSGGPGPRRGREGAAGGGRPRGVRAARAVHGDDRDPGAVLSEDLRPGDRDPDAVLDELGGELGRRFAAPPRRRVRHPVALVALLVLALVPTAVATRDVLRAPAPPAPPGAERPARAGTQVWVAAGREDGVPWRLSASGCAVGDEVAVGLFLAVPGGGAGARCDVAPRGVPRVAARRVHTYVDPDARRTWAFGAAPAEARAVEVVARSFSTAAERRRVALRPADPEAVARGRLPAGLQVFVVALPGAREVPLVRVLDGTGAVLATCRDGRCV